MKSIYVSAFALLGGLFWAASASAQTALTGVWRVQDVSVDGERLQSTATEPGLIFFGNEYYSATYVNATRTREPQDMPRPGFSYEQIIALYEPFSASAGTYEMEGPTLTVRPIVAAVGARFVSEEEITSEYQLDGDRLVLTSTNDEGARIVRTLLRLE